MFRLKLFAIITATVQGLASVQGRAWLLRQAPGSEDVEASGNRTAEAAKADEEVDESRLLYPSETVTSEDVRRANGKVFVSEIVRQEDRRISRLASEAVEAALAAQRLEDLAAAQAKQRGQAVETAALAVTGAVANKIGSDAKNILNYVAESTMDAGRRAQAAEDQQAIADLLGTHARDMRDAAADAEAAALGDRMQADASHLASKEFAVRAATEGASADNVVALAVQDRRVAQDSRAEEQSRASQVEQAARAQVQTTVDAMRDVNRAAVDQIGRALQTQDVLSAAQAAPVPFASGLARGLQQ